MSTSFLPDQQFDVGAIMGGLYGDGIIGCKGAFAREWIAGLGADIAVLFDEARARPGGALERGPHRHYVEVHPERLRGFAELLAHPWLVAVCEAVLGRPAAHTRLLRVAARAGTAPSGLPPSRPARTAGAGAYHCRPADGADGLAASGR